MCFGRATDDEQRRSLARTKQIDTVIRKEAKDKVREVKLLLLGASFVENIFSFRSRSPSHLRSFWPRPTLEVAAARAEEGRGGRGGGGGGGWRSVVKLLTLYVLLTAVAEAHVGAGESGKSTVLKQMKLIYAQGFSKAEREDCRSTIFSNLVTAFRTIFKAMDELDLNFENPDNDVRAPPPVVRMSVVLTEVRRKEVRAPDRHRTRTRHQ